MPGRVRGLCQVPSAGGEVGPWQYQHSPARHVSSPPRLSVPTGQQWRGVPALLSPAPRSLCPNSLERSWWGLGSWCHGTPGRTLPWKSWVIPPPNQDCWVGGMTEQV